MNQDRKSWNIAIVKASFPPLINNAILSIPISDREQDTYVWEPSLSRAFSINSAYRVMNVARFGVLSADDKRKWKLL